MPRKLVDLLEAQCIGGSEQTLNVEALINVVAHLPRALGYSRLLTATDALRFQQVNELSRQYRVPLTACGDVLTHEKLRQPLQDILTAVRNKTTVDELGALAEKNAERVLRPINSLAHLYPNELLIESAQIAATCRFTLDELCALNQQLIRVEMCEGMDGSQDALGILFG